MLTLTKPLPLAEAKLALAADKIVRAKAPHLRPAHLATWSEAPLLVQDKTRPWVLTPLEADPLRTSKAGYPLPARIAKELAALSATGVEFHRIAIAHELEPSARTTALLAKGKGGPLALTAAETKELVGPLPTPKSTIEAAKKTDDGIAAIFAGVGKAVAGAADAVIDPIIFGVVGVGGAPKPGTPALYYPLAAWEW